MSKLFETSKLKNIDLKNRIFIPPMVTRFSKPDTGFAETETAEHYRKMAQGGPALIIQEATCISKDGRLMDRQLGIWNDEHIKGLKKIVKAVHEENCAIIAQIHHAGILSISNSPICPDNYSFVMTNGQTKSGRAMTLSEIDLVQRDFVNAAVRAYKAGYDGIELHGCHQYLICQFLNKKVNKRTDKYGVDRTLFIREIMESIRKELPESFIVGIRLGGFEPTLEDSVDNALQIEKMGFDYINVSYGFQMEQEVYSPENYPFLDIIYAAEKIKQSVSIPVFAANGITTSQMAEEVLERTNADLVGIGRGFIVDPDWANNAMKGHETGRCLHCKKCRLYDDPEKCPGKILFERQKRKTNI